MPGTDSELAPAKVNLTLHVTGRRPDGYHLLDSLVVFPRLGDLVEAEPAADLSLSLHGPFATALGAKQANLVLRAAQMLRPPEQGASLRLRKSLPVAAGLGGGSSDAAATLRLLARLWGTSLPPVDVLMADLGADVPVCMIGRSSRMRGVGDVLVPALVPPCWIVLANPNAQVATAEVFRTLEHAKNAPMRMKTRESFADCDAFFGFLRSQRNDLEASALRLAPVVSDVLAALAQLPGVGVRRMSGSGATCFGLFAREEDALAAADILRRNEPGWWVDASSVG